MPYFFYFLVKYLLVFLALGSLIHKTHALELHHPDGQIVPIEDWIDSNIAKNPELLKRHVRKGAKARGWALAISHTGYWGFAYDQFRQEAAERSALGYCENGGNKCKIIAKQIDYENGQLINEEWFSLVESVPGTDEEFSIQKVVDVLQESLLAVEKARAAEEKVLNLPESHKRRLNWPEVIWVGEVRSDMPHGYGTYTWYGSKGERIYRGQAERGAGNGYGMVRTWGGTACWGKHSAGHIHGLALCHLTDGSKHIGKISHSLFQGVGIRYHPDGKIQAGVWQGSVGYVGDTLVAGKEYVQGEAPAELWKGMPGPWTHKNTVTPVKSAEEGAKLEHSPTVSIPEDRTDEYSPTASSTLAPIEKAKAECEELGFRPKTEKYGDCVLRLMEMN